MPEISIDALLASAPVDPQAHLEPDRVAHYVESREPVAPVLVYETAEGLLLVDGYHRVAAALQRAATTVEAEVREGTRHDALLHAAAIGAAQRGLAPSEAIERIERRSGSRRGSAAR